MVCFQTPPGLTSIFSIVVVKPRGPHQCTTCRGSVIACHTSSRGASKFRVMTISRSAVSSMVLFSRFFILFLLFLQFAQIIVQTVKAFFPEKAVVFHPGGDFLERLRSEPAGAPLRMPSAGDQLRALEHLEMLADGGPAHVKRPGEFLDRPLAVRPAGQKWPPGGIGAGRQKGGLGGGWPIV